MLYQAMRPKSFEEVVGHESVVSAMQKIVQDPPELRPHAFLLSGESGCGKTTVARIMINALGVDPDLDYTELNAANSRGIDTVREVVARASFPPLKGEARAYLFDEAHQLTSAAQEALLKVVEDCPLHCYFFFCTTVPDGLIKTLRNRCTKHAFPKLRPPQIMEIVLIADAVVGMSLDEKVIEKVVDCADGCPREALVLYEKVMHLDKETALNSLSTTISIEKEIVDLCRVIVSRRDTRWRDALKTLSNIQDIDMEAARRQITGYIRKVMLGAKNKEEAAVLAAQIQAFDKNFTWGGRALFDSVVLEACTI